MTEQQKYWAELARLEPAIAELLTDMEREVEAEREREEAERAKTEAKIKVFRDRQTALLIKELGDQIPAAIRPYLEADTAKPVLDDESWRPAYLWVDAPGLHKFVLKVQLSNGHPIISEFRIYDDDDLYTLHHWRDVITEARLRLQFRAEREAAASRQEKQTAQEDPSSAGERLAALIDEIITDRVAELMRI